MSYIGTSFFFVTCSDCPFVDDFFVGTVFFPVLRKQCYTILYPSFSLNYVWILLLLLLLYSLPFYCSRITSIRSGMSSIVSNIQTQLFLCSLITICCSITTKFTIFSILSYRILHISFYSFYSLNSTMQ